MNRPKKRETERYGEKLFTDKKIEQDSIAFLEWANKYEDPNFEGRSLKIHNDWIKKLDCKVVRIAGETPLNEKTEKVLMELKNTLKLTKCE